MGCAPLNLLQLCLSPTIIRLGQSVFLLLSLSVVITPMKFICVCGKTLSDNTDDIPYKARMVADEDWNRFTESFGLPQGHDWRLVTHIYQCPDCGSLRIEKPAGQVVFFKPETEGASKTLLRAL